MLPLPLTMLVLPTPYPPRLSRNMRCRLLLMRMMMRITFFAPKDRPLYSLVVHSRKLNLDQIEKVVEHFRVLHAALTPVFVDGFA